MVYLAFSSIDRTLGDDGNFTLFSDQNVARYQAVRLHQVTMINSLYNVTSTNNSFIVEVAADADGEGAVEYEVNLPEGNYSITTLLAALKTAIDTESGSTFTFTVNSLTGKLTMAIGADYFSLGLGGLNLMLGFSQSSVTAFVQTLDAGRCYNLNRYANLYLLTNLLKDRSWLSAANDLRPILGSIPIGSVDFQQQLTYEPAGENRFISLQSSDINSSQFYLVDDQSNPVSLNGLYLTIVLEAI